MNLKIVGRILIISGMIIAAINAKYFGGYSAQLGARIGWVWTTENILYIVTIATIIGGLGLLFASKKSSNGAR